MRELAVNSAVLSRIDFFTPRSRYVFTSTLAAALALGVAYLLQLDTPYSAASTVLLVINPVQGAVIGKGSWRILGTVVGMLMAFVLMAAFAQMPLLFILGFGAWLGLCVAGMTLLRHFRGSGAVVAGYTIGLATYGAMQHPELTFEHVIGRGSTVVVGVVCLGLVSVLLASRGVRARLEAQVIRLTSAAGQWLASRHAAKPATAPDAAHHALLTEIYGIDDLLALGKAESEDLAQRAAAVREGMVALFGALVGGAPPLPAGSASAAALAALQPALERAWADASAALPAGPNGAAEARRILLAARGRFAEGLAQASLADATQEAALLITGDRLLEQLDDYLDALRGIESLHHTRPGLHGGQAPVHFHRDFRSAWHNGLRAMLAIVGAGAFWIATGWDQGDMMLLVLAPYCTLLATSGNPAAGAIEFIKGTVIAVPVALVCAFVVLPHIDGFPLLVVVLALLWLPGIYATSVPKTALAGLAYLVAVNTLVGAGNPMHLDLGLFLNQSLAWVLATFVTLLAFRVVLPRNLPRDIMRLRHRMRDEALGLLHGRLPAGKAWRHRQQHRLAQVGTLLKADPPRMGEAIAEGLAALHLGRELLRIRGSAVPAVARAAVHQGLGFMRRRAACPAKAALHARSTARALARLADAHAADRQPLQRLMAAFADVANLLDTHAAFFTSTPARPKPC